MIKRSCCTSAASSGITEFPSLPGTIWENEKWLRYKDRGYPYVSVVEQKINCHNYIRFIRKQAKNLVYVNFLLYNRR